MEDVFYSHIIKYIPLKDINNYTLISKHVNIKKIQKYINKLNSAKLLKNCLFYHKNTFKDNIFFLINNNEFNNITFIKYLVEILLKEKEIDSIDNFSHYEKNKIFVPKYVISNTIIYFNSQRKIVNIDFTTHQEIIKNVKICSIYRMGGMQKSILIEYYPYAKALIY